MNNSEKTRNRLLEMRRDIVNSVEVELQETKTSQVAEIGDDVDYASEERQRELTQLFQTRQYHKLELIDQAIEKITTNEYGICESCEEPIASKRLVALPLAKFCIECQMDNELAQRAGSGGSYQEHPIV